MAFRFGGNTAKGGNSDKSKSIGQIRRAQLVTTFGAGALADFPDYSVVMGSPEYWKHVDEIREDRLARYLNVKRFKAPRASEDMHIDDGVVKTFRFPYMHYCPKCHKLGRYWEITGKDGRTCPNCKCAVLPSRFVVACEDGHLSDFPYNWWVHGGYWKKGHELRIEYSQDVAGLAGIKVICDTCGKTRTLEKVTTQGALTGFKCRGERPWIGNRPEDSEGSCSARVWAVQRGATNLYYSVNVSALSIPVFKSEFIESNWKKIAKVFDMFDTLDAQIDAIDFKYEDELEEAGLTAAECISLVRDRMGKGTGDSAISKQDIYESEYRALSGPDADEKDFKTQRIPAPNGFESLISGVTVVGRLREVLVQRGFRRIVPEGTLNSTGETREFMPLFKEQTDWLPATEMFGEGVFIRLNRVAVDQWARRMSGRYEQLRKRLAHSTVQCENFSPAYVLLHTFAHSLIRQLTVDCGYSGAALKERIYSTYPGSDLDMCGVLVYTSSTDSDGSLGGLIRQCKPETLGETIRRMLYDASWCSSDPVCGESTAQGFDSLNYAACHACELLPETSCEVRNCLLDRVALIGTLEDPSLGFFGVDE